MSESTPPFWLQVIAIMAVLAGVLGYVRWKTHRQGGEEFRVLRVLGITVAAASMSLPFVAWWWWLKPRDADRHSPLLLTAVFLPIFMLEVWGFALELRRHRRRETTSEPPISERGGPPPGNEAALQDSDL